MRILVDSNASTFIWKQMKMMTQDLAYKERNTARIQDMLGGRLRLA